MKFNCGLDGKEWFAARTRWHRWFAWPPIRIASHDCRWLEMIERKGTFYPGWGEAYWCWEYRAMLTASQPDKSEDSAT